MRKYFINIKDCVKIRHYFIIMPTKHQICYLLNRDSFTLRKIWKWFKSLKIQELLMNGGLSRPSAQDQSKSSLHPTRRRNWSTWFLHMHVSLLYLIKHDCDEIWKKKLATIGRSKTLYWGRANFICRVHSTGYCHKGILT